MSTRARDRTVLGAGVFIVFSFLAATCPARLGETPEQCAQRYGTNILERTGGGDLLFVRVYTNGDYQITAGFIRQPAAPPVAGLVVYGKRLSPLGKVAGGTTNDWPSMMATVPGVWAGYEEKRELAPPQDSKVRKIEIESVAVTRKKRAMKVVNQLLPRVAPDGLSLDARVTDVAHNGISAFAFGRRQQFVLISWDGVMALESYSKALMMGRPQSVKPTPAPLGP